MDAGTDGTRDDDRWHHRLVTALATTADGEAAAPQARGLVLEQCHRDAGMIDLVVRGTGRDIVVAEGFARGEFECPQLGLGAGGHFVVVWQETARYRIMARRFDPQGVPQGDTFVVNSTGGEVPRTHPLVAVNPSGSFVVLWEHGWLRMRARLFTSAGVAIGNETDVTSPVVR